MAVYVWLAATTALVAYLVVGWYLPFRRNLKAAQRSGIPYIVVPVFFIRPLWLITYLILVPVLKRVPSKWVEWVDFCIPDSIYDYRMSFFQRLGHDSFLAVAPGGNVLHTCDASVISQITTRRNDFPKPTSIYVSVNIYGRNVVSSEGAEWRQHRKATSPPFTEKNNHLVWAETIGQATRMIASWVGPDGKGGKTVDRVADDTMRLSLHVISRAGFGRSMEWPTEESKFSEKLEYVDPSKIKNEEEGTDESHSMSWTYALHCLLDGIILQFIFPRWFLTNLPVQAFKKASMAYTEWGNYMKEAVQNKKTEVLSGGKAVDQMDILGQMVKGQMSMKDIRGSVPLNDAEILGNMFVLILAGHETTANSIHFSMLYLALFMKSQRALQKDLDDIFQGRPPSEWDYDRDLPSLFGGMTGAVLAEELRLIPPVIGLPKSTWGVSDQKLTVEGKECIVPAGTYINVAIACVHRNPKHWPTGKPMLPGGKTVHPLSNLDNDLEEFKPERWLVREDGEAQKAKAAKMLAETIAGGDLGVNESADTSDQLYKPVKGAYLPFSDGWRACLGRRFAQVEVLVAIAMIFQNYSVELAVDKYASDEEVTKMDVNERAEVWQKAAENARELMLNETATIITLQIRGNHVPLRLVPRGQERFVTDVDEVWKDNHPDRCTGTRGVPDWCSWRGREGRRVHHI